MFQTEIDTSRLEMQTSKTEMCMFKTDTFTSKIETHKSQAKMAAFQTCLKLIPMSQYETPTTQTEINTSQHSP